MRDPRGVPSRPRCEDAMTEASRDFSPCGSWGRKVIYALLPRWGQCAVGGLSSVEMSQLPRADPPFTLTLKAPHRSDEK